MHRKPRLKITLYEKGLTQRELARKSGIPEGYISRYISGRFNLSDREKESIARVVGVDPRLVFPE